MPGRKGVPLLERLLARLDAGDCWEWTGTIARNGYGVFMLLDPAAGKVVLRMAHRLVYEQLVGPIPAGLDLDHLCRNRPCCNPDHLEPVTRAENLRRGIGGKLAGLRQARLTHCANGHPFNEVNTGICSRGWRFCLICRRAADRRHRARVKEQAA